MQALAQQLSGLSFYTQRPADAPHPAMYNGLLPAAPVHSAALLDGLQPSEAGYLAQPLIPSVHAMHAAAMQQVPAGPPRPLPRALPPFFCYSLQGLSASELLFSKACVC